MTQTYFPKSTEKHPANFWLVDAKDKVLGRLAARIARLLCGKDNPLYTPDRDMGDHVIVVNARELSMRGNNKLLQAFVATHSGYPSGLRIRTAKEIQEKHPERLLYLAVSGMMPKTRLGQKMLKKLRVYPDAAHPHEAQKLKPLDLK